MTNDWWQTLSPLLDELLDLPEAGQEVWLHSFAAKNPDQAAALRKLLDDHRTLASNRFLETPQIQTPRPGQLAGTYKLISLIGQGGMGSVWLAHRDDGRFESQVAVKFLNVALALRGQQRFRREGSLLGRLSHPHIAKLFDAGLSPSGQAFLVLEYVDGQHIDQYCINALLSINQRIHLFLDVIAAVEHAHANLIVHRDIKASNVLVNRQGEVKLVDFGIAKWIEEEDRPTSAATLTRESGLPLTPEFASPEQLSGEPVTVATDTFMLGGLLYLLLTSQKPTGQGPHSSLSLVDAIVHSTPPLMSSIVSIAGHQNTLRGDLDTIVAKALKKSPSERYPTSAAMAEDLRRYLNHLPITARPDSLSYRATRFVRRNRAVVTLSSLAILAATAGLLGTIFQARRANDERDFAWRQLARAEAVNDLNSFVLSDAAPSGKPFTVNELLARAEAIATRQNNQDPATRINLLVSIGRQYYSQDEDAKARRVLEQAYTLSSAVADQGLRSTTACALASSLARAGDQQRANALFAEGSSTLPQQPQYLLDRIFCLLRGSEIARDQGASQDAISRVEQAQLLLQTAPFQSQLAQLRLSMDLAEALRIAGRQREAAAAFSTSSILLQSLGRDQTQTAGTLFNNWALTLNQLGLPLQAAEIFRRAILVSKDGEDETALSPMLMLNYARVLRELCKLTDAAGYAERATLKAQKASQEVVINQALLLRSAIYRDQGKLALSSQMLDEATPRLSRALPAGHIAFASVAAERALNAQAFGDLYQAETLLNQAIAITELSIKAGKQGADFLPTHLVRRANLKLAQQRFDSAASDATKALDLLLPMIPAGTFSSNLGRAYLTYGRALLAKGDQPQAKANFSTASQHLEKSLGDNHPEALVAKALSNPKPN